MTKHGRHTGWCTHAPHQRQGCFPNRKRYDAAASLIVNPLTAVGLLDTARREGHAAAIQTAAASQLGRMLLRLANQDGYPLICYPLICVVRREEQVQLLRSLGANLVLNSSDTDSMQQLAEMCQRVNATAAFDAVAGDMTGTLLGGMPANSSAYVYGALAEEPCGNIKTIDLILHSKRVSGFYLGVWLQQRGSLHVLRAANRLQRMMIRGELETQVQCRVGFDQVVDGLQQYVEHMTNGKTLILPQKG